MWVRTTDLVQSPTVQVLGDLKETLIQYVLTAYHIPFIRPSGRAAKVLVGRHGVWKEWGRGVAQKKTQSTGGWCTDYWSYRTTDQAVLRSTPENWLMLMLESPLQASQVVYPIKHFMKWDRSPERRRIGSVQDSGFKFILNVDIGTFFF